MSPKQIGKFKLFYKGEWDDNLFTKCMTIVGSRRMTDYGRRVIEKIVPRLVQDGWTIVSGFMYGVDQYAHKICMENGGRTIAVLGWGIDQENDTKIIESGGLLVSLWKDQLGTLWTFPARDRVMAALGHELIVIEAGLKSGSLITAEMAYKLGKPIWAIPGPITSSVSVGTNKLIAEGKAKIYLSSNPSPGQRHERSENLGEGNSRGEVLDLVADEGLDVSEIARRLNRSASDVGAELTMLILKGDIEEREGKYYVS